MAYNASHVFLLSCWKCIYMESSPTNNIQKYKLMSWVNHVPWYWIQSVIHTFLISSPLYSLLVHRTSMNYTLMPPIFGGPVSSGAIKCGYIGGTYRYLSSMTSISVSSRKWCGIDLPFQRSLCIGPHHVNICVPCTQVFCTHWLWIVNIYLKPQKGVKGNLFRFLTLWIVTRPSFSP